MRKLTLIIGALALCASATARTITTDEAANIAATFSSSTAAAMRVRPATSATPQLIHTETGAAGNLFYVFNRPGRGFVIVAADDKAETILAYSDSDEITSMDALPDNMRAWLAEYARQIAIVKTMAAATAPRHEARQAVSPLLGATKWGQTAPFNDDCPEVALSGGGTTNAVTGCVATAMAQVMRYHRHPAAPRGDLHYVWSHEDKPIQETMTRNFTGHTYDWDNMLDDYTAGDITDAQRAAVSLLMADCAYSVEMQFAEKASASSTQLVPFAMATYFGYDAAAIFEERSFHTDAEWESLISDELEARRPVIYTGQTQSKSAHTWVIDGTDGRGMYHINWGWGGFENGYFALTGANILAPETGGTGGSDVKESYDMAQAAIFGLKPNAGGTPRIDFVSMEGEALSLTELARPIATPQTAEEVWLSLTGTFLNHSNRGTDRYCDFGMRVTNIATGESITVSMPLAEPVLMQSLMALQSIDVPRLELQFLPSGTYDVEAVYRDYEARVVGGEMQYVGDGQWKTFRHILGQPAAQRLELTGTVPSVYLSEPVTNERSAIDHLTFTATLHANADIDAYIVPLLFEATGIDPATGYVANWQANMQRQNLPNTHVAMRAGETQTVWLGEWKYDVPDSELPELLMLQLTLSPNADGYWDSANIIAPAYYGQCMFQPTVATAIATVSPAPMATPKVFTIGGQCLGTRAAGLKPGIYVVGGKKVAVK